MMAVSVIVCAALPVMPMQHLLIVLWMPMAKLLLVLPLRKALPVIKLQHPQRVHAVKTR